MGNVWVSQWQLNMYWYTQNYIISGNWAQNSIFFWPRIGLTQIYFLLYPLPTSLSLTRNLSCLLFPKYCGYWLVPSNAAVVSFQVPVFCLPIAAIIAAIHNDMTLKYSFQQQNIVFTLKKKPHFLVCLHYQSIHMLILILMFYHLLTMES